MPGSDRILEGLYAIANGWPLLAVFWHLFFGALAVALIAGWRPARRDMGLYLVLPFISVSALAWLQANPFNGTAVAVAGLALLVVSVSLGRGPVRPGPVWMIAAAAVLFAFGWGYPDFLETESPWAYLYQAPTGLIPSPTLAMVSAFTLALGGFGSRAWCYLLAAAAAFYGLVGAVHLGVALDWLLLAGAVLLAVAGRAAHGGPAGEEAPSTG